MSIRNSKINNSQKIAQLTTDLKDKKLLKRKLSTFSNIEMQQIITEILFLTEKEYLSRIKKGIETQIEESYSKESLTNPHLLKLLTEEIYETKIKYKRIHTKIIQSLNTKKKKKEYLKTYRKHCFTKSDDLAEHNCGTASNKFFLLIRLEKNAVKFVICLNCKKVYLSTMIFMKCAKCNKD